MSPPTDDGVDQTTLLHFVARAVLAAADRLTDRSPHLRAADLTEAMIARLSLGIDGRALMRVVNMTARVEGRTPTAATAKRGSR